MRVMSPGCVYCGEDHNARTCNYQLVLLIESYADKHTKLDPQGLANEIADAGWSNNG